MPEIFREDGYVCFFYANEGHEPVHVHIRHAGGYAKFWLDPLALEHAEGMKVQELARAEDLIQKYEMDIRRKWHEIFGN